MTKIKTALISVYDKDKILDFVKELHKLKIEIISTGGTAKLLKENKIPVTSISSFTKSPELLDGRVKSLHPKIQAGILAVRKNKKHLSELKKQKIKPIDLVVVNLYPFEEKVQKNANLNEILENIDIGGPSLIRAAAKNYQDVAILTNKEQYDFVLKELKKTKTLSLKTKEKLAAEAFNHVAYYDNLIDNYFQKKFGKNLFSRTLNLTFKKIQPLRYGENPNQKAAFYSFNLNGINFEQLHGKQLSYNNILDLETAFNLVNEFSEPTAVIVKHTNPCGVASCENLIDAYKSAYSCDPVSAFGGIIGINRTLTAELAKEMKIFVEEIIAPDYEPEALTILKQKKSLRIIKAHVNENSRKIDLRCALNGILTQTSNFQKLNKKNLKIVSGKRPSKQELDDLLFAWKVCKYVKSNAIVLAKNKKTIGIGAGQMSRVDSVKIAVEKSHGKAVNSVMASDAFFPFRDAVDLSANSGITSIIQPGGSIRDKEIIRAVNEHKLAMVFTGIRTFRH